MKIEIKINATKTPSHQNLPKLKCLTSNLVYFCVFVFWWQKMIPEMHKLFFRSTTFYAFYYLFPIYITL